MSIRRLTLAFFAAAAIVAAGCTNISPDQSVNISELHDGVVRLMPFAQDGIRAKIAEQQTIANDETKPQADREAAAAAVELLQASLLETVVLPGVSQPIRDWAIAAVGTEAYLKAKQDRDTMIGAGGSNGAR